MMVISDDRAAESIAGVMGGEESGVTEDTVNVFLESAYWDPITIAHTGRALKINSDAKYRFERGVDPAFTLPGLELATQMVLDLCGGEASEVVTCGRRARHDPRLSSWTPRGVPRWSAWTFPPRPNARRWRRWASRWTATWRPRQAGAPTCRARPIWSKKSRASPR